MNKIEQLSVTIQSLETNNDEKIKEHIRSLVNDLIENDFSQLVQLLYRVDVSEAKLKNLLHDHPQTDAAVLITDLLIERQLEKSKLKKKFGRDDDIPEKDRW